MRHANVTATPSPRQRPPFPAIALLSASALAYEVLLLRLFSIIQWHHFAYMIISLALLGYAFSGTFLALLGGWAERGFTALFAANAALFGVSSAAGFLIAQIVPFNPLELMWGPAQWLRMAAIYLLLSVPFVFAATGIGLCFLRFRKRMGRVYASDLLGAGGGAIGVVVLLLVLRPIEVLAIVGGFGFAAAALALVYEARIHRPSVAALVALAVIYPLVLSGPWTQLRMSPYKELSQALGVTGAVLVKERSSPLGLLSAVENRKVPFRHAPGLSIASPVAPPDQVAIFIDGGGPSVINRFHVDEKPPDYLDYMTTALPYHLLDRPRTLVLGAGGGSEVLQALYHNAAAIDAVDIDPQMVALVRRDFADFGGGIYDHPDVRLHVAEARGFVTAANADHDLIQVALVDTFGAAGAGLYALNESYLYTVEALQLFIARLAPGGMLALTRWTKMPPRDALKMFATAVAALRGSGVGNPGDRLAMIRGWNTATLLVKNGPFTADEIAMIRTFSQKRSFDTVWFPGMGPAEANRYNRLDQPYFHRGARTLLGAAADDYIGRYKYDIAPATDDRPYFFNFFRWRLLGELLDLRERGGLGLLEWGYPVLVATLAQAVIASVVLILLPLSIAGRGKAQAGRARKLRVFVYFLCLGFAFLFVEIAFIQKFILLLGHPVYAAAVVLSAFLVFAGLGSLFSEPVRNRLPAGSGSARVGVFSVIGIATVAAAYVSGLPPLIQALAPLSVPVKGAVALLLIAPPAFFMGMPFPLGLASLGDRSPEFIPWAWAINGCASVLGAVLAGIVAVHAGFAAVILLAAGLYVLAVRTFP